MGNVFENYKFMEGASEQEFFDAAVENVSKLMQFEEVGLARDTIAGIMAMAIEIGVMDDGEMSEQEERMIKYVVEKTIPDKLDAIMNQINGSISVDFTLIRLAQLKQMATPDLLGPVYNLILCFAYVDGVFDETRASRLSDIIDAVVM